MIIPAFGDRLDRVGDVGVRGKYDRRRTTMFERAACAGRQLTTEHPADAAAANEAEEPDSSVRHQTLSNCVVGQDRDLRPSFRQSGLAQYLDKLQATERRNVGGFHDDGTTCRNRRRDLMHDEVQWVIKRADGNHHANRFALRECGAVR